MKAHVLVRRILVLAAAIVALILTALYFSGSLPDISATVLGQTQLVDSHDYGLWRYTVSRKDAALGIYICNYSA